MSEKLTWVNVMRVDDVCLCSITQMNIQNESTPPGYLLKIIGKIFPKSEISMKLYFSEITVLDAYIVTLIQQGKLAC